MMTTTTTTTAIALQWQPTEKRFSPNNSSIKSSDSIQCSPVSEKRAAPASNKKSSKLRVNSSNVITKTPPSAAKTSHAKG